MTDYKKLLEEVKPKSEQKNKSNSLKKIYYKIKDSVNPLDLGIGIAIGALGYAIGYLGSIETDLLTFATHEIPKIPGYVASSQASISSFDLMLSYAGEVGKRSAVIYSSLGYFVAHKFRKSISSWWDSKFHRGEEK